MKTNKPILSYKGIQIYEGFKNGVPLRYWYALRPASDAEQPVIFPDARQALPAGYVPKPMFEIRRHKPSDVFDVRKLPPKYAAGLLIEDKQLHRPLRVDLMRAERDAHLEAMRRAIDDGYDFGIGENPKKTGRIRHWLAAFINRKIFFY